MNAVAAFGRRLVRGPAAARILARLGVDPHRYWLVYDLFGTLSARQEVTMLGADYSLRTAALLWFLLSGLMSVVLVVAGSSPAGYLLVFLGLTAFVLGVHLVSEVAENLVNPVAELTLAHQPVGAGTWSAAKLSHLLTVVVYLVGGINGVPAVSGTLLARSRTPPCTCWPRSVRVWSWPCSAAACSAGWCASYPSVGSRRSRR